MPGAECAVSGKGQVNHDRHADWGCALGTSGSAAAHEASSNALRPIAVLDWAASGTLRNDLSSCRSIARARRCESPICLGIKWQLAVHRAERTIRRLARVLLTALGMSTNTRDSKRRAEGTVLVIGGSGGMSSLYRNVVEKQGLVLRHYENRLPSDARRSVGKVALIVIMIGMVSHALLQQVRSMPMDGAPVVYLRTASVSALRAAVAGWNDARPALHQGLS
jgi:hypothetical protein